MEQFFARVRCNVVVATVAALAAGCTAVEPGAPLAPRLEGLGDHHHSISTDSPDAQRFFDQGLVLAYGFNHAEALRSFEEAARLDPECAMCFWGQALVRGPNINATMEDSEVAAAFAAMEKAKQLAAGASAKEQAYIEALAVRYVPEAREDRSELDHAYAEAMGELAAGYPEDTDAGTLWAESLMNTTPWDYWQEDGEPKPITETFLAELERVLEIDPKHPGANHFYIHAVEAVKPELGIPAAERLAGVAPLAGHLVHMPSHIYIRVGRYHDAASANEEAIAADDEYTTQCHAQGMYPLVYMPHNHHFLWAAATLEGRSETALAAAQHMESSTDQELMREPSLVTLQHYRITPVLAQVRFGRWDEILERPEPDEDLVYPRGVWHYARGMAHTRQGELDAARTELDALLELVQDPVLEGVTIWDLNTAAHLLDIASEVLAGELAAAREDWEKAVEHLEYGAELEDRLNYDEPPPWHAPVRQNLGAVLLAAGRPEDAERVYLEDLERLPENGWSLFGLAEALEAQGKKTELESAQSRLATAWANADVELSSSRF